MIAMDSDETRDAELVARLKRLDAGAGAPAPAFDYDGMLTRHAQGIARARRRAVLTRVAAVHDAPRPPFRRLTLSLSFLISTAEIWVVAVGERKRTLVQAAVRRNFSNTPLDLLLRHAPQVTIYTDQVVLRR